MTTVKLNVDASAMQHALSALSEAVELLPEVREYLLGIFDAGEEIVCVDGYLASAGAADELTVRLYPSDRLARLVAAARAGDRDLFTFEHGALRVHEPDISTPSGAAQ